MANSIMYFDLTVVLYYEYLNSLIFSMIYCILLINNVKIKNKQVG